jgi:hypothetical protein
MAELQRRPQKGVRLGTERLQIISEVEGVEIPLSSSEIAQQ